MNELIKVTDSNGTPGVDARELHAFLEVGKDFTTWIKSRIEKYGFVDSEDYETCSPNLGSKMHGGHNATDYTLSLDMAKELAMVENNDRGREARRYFIEVEKRYRNTLSVPKNFAEALQLAADQARQIEQQERELLEAKPKVDFYDAVAGSKDAVEMKDAAKVLDMGLGRNRLFAFLRDRDILMHDNTPYQQYIDRGYFRVVEQKYMSPDGETHISLKTLVYQKGLDYIRKVLADA